jgi:hypothetical protein
LKADVPDTWTECSFHVQGRHVGVAVKRLEPDERQRMAAEIAWFAEGLLTPGVELSDTGWPAFLSEILAHCVSITLDEDRLDNADGFWQQVICRTFEAFAVANRLYPHGLIDVDPGRQRSGPIIR